MRQRCPGAALATASLLAQLAGRGELVGLVLNLGVDLPAHVVELRPATYAVQ